MPFREKPSFTPQFSLMRPGDRWMVRFPAHLMYAGEGDGLIPPNSSVTSEVELEEVIQVGGPTEGEPADTSADPR